MDFRELIRLMSDGAFHSGEQLGEILGVSRTAIWKQLRKLEALGIRVEGIRGQGYRLAHPIELLDGARIVSHLTSAARHALSRLFVEMSLDSTNSFILRRFSQQAGHGEVCLAEMQVSGRGRRGRQWVASLGQGLCVSLGWRFEPSASHLEGLSLAIGVEVAKMLEEMGVPVRLKWPNDLLVERSDGVLCKLGGVLVELRGDVNGPCEVVAGLGLNVHEVPTLETLPQPVASIAEYAGHASRNEVAANLISRLLTMFERFEREGFTPWRQDWNSYHAYRDMDIDIVQGVQQWQGRALDVDDNGNLEVMRDGQVQKLSGGEISIRKYS